MVEFDAQQANAPQVLFQQDQARIAFREQNVNYLSNNIQQLQNDVPAPIPQPVFHPNLNLPTPPSFSSIPLELPVFKLKLIQFLVGNQNTYHGSETQLLYAGQLLKGPAGQWYHALVDPHTT